MFVAALEIGGAITYLLSSRCAAGKAESLTRGEKRFA
jgi:hypothetical protein